MSDQFLYEFQKQPPFEFSNRLYERINPVRTPGRKGVPGLAYGFCGFLLGLLLLFSFSPAARVHAQEIIYQIGQWIISHQPTAAEQFENKLNSAEIGAYDTSENEIIAWQAPVWIAADDAETMVGFKVYQLQLNNFNAEPVFREVQAATDKNTTAFVSAVYRLEGRNLVFKQTKIDDGNDGIELPVGEAEVKQVALADGEAYWIENLRLSTYLNEENKVEPKFANVLIWEKDGFEFWLQTSPGLPLEDMMLLAQGIY